MTGRMVTFLCQLRSILIIIFKEKTLSLRQKLIVEGDCFISMGMSFQHLAPK